MNKKERIGKYYSRQHLFEVIIMFIVIVLIGGLTLVRYKILYDKSKGNDYLIEGVGVYKENYYDYDKLFYGKEKITGKMLYREKKRKERKEREIYTIIVVKKIFDRDDNKFVSMFFDDIKRVEYVVGKEDYERAKERIGGKYSDFRERFE